jgi:outer membrane protein TolC
MRIEVNMANHSISFLRRLAGGGLLALLAGCATFSADGGMEEVSSLTTQRTGQEVKRVSNEAEAVNVEETINALLARPLTPDSAVQIALLNNRGLQAALAALGVSEAELVQAGRLRNPGFSFGRMDMAEGKEIERSVMFDLVGLLTLPARSRIEQHRFEQAKQQAAADAVRVAGEARLAYFNAVAAQQIAQYTEQVMEAAEASAEMARRMAAVGNISKLAQTREQAFYAEATAQLARARHNAVAAREQLSRVLGLWGKQVAYGLPERLPDLPEQARNVSDIESLAMQQRLDVRMAKRNAEASARALGLTRATGFVNVFHLGYVNKNETGEPRADGYELELELPIFDWGGAKVEKAQSLYMKAVHQTADTAIRARSEVREAYSAYRTSYDLARHYRDEIVPLRSRISEEMLYRYNGMLAGIFELLADAREQITAVNGAIEAQRDYWLADTNLQMAINGSGGNTIRMSGSVAAAEAQGH